MEEEEFSIVELTAAINNHPFVPGQLGRLESNGQPLFEEDGVSTTTIKIEELDGKLDIIEPSARGGAAATLEGDDDRRRITFDIDHFEIPDAVNADEVQGVKMFGSDDELEVIDDRVNRKLLRHARAMDLTLEHQRIGAIKGIVLSGKGKVLHNLYDRFGIAVPDQIQLGLDGQVSGIASLIKNEVVYRIEEELDGTYDHIHAMCGNEFHDNLWEQKEVRETFLADNQGYQLRDGAPDIFRVGRVTYERYRTGRKATAANGGSAFIASNEARAFPVGAPDLFLTRFAPGDWNGLPNTIGLPRYSRMKEKYNDKGYHLDSQMNAISLCTNPKTLLKLVI